MRFGKIDVRYLGGVLALAFTLLIIMSAVLGQGADWWSAWGQWIGGIGSIIAAGVAVWIAQHGWAQAQEEAREREASKFAVWVISDGSPTPVVKFVNTTALPVYDVVASTRISVFEHTIRLGTVSPTDRTGSEFVHAGHRLADSVRIAVFERIGQDKYYDVDAAGDKNITRAAISESLDVIRRFELSVSFRQGKHRWRVDHDGALTQL